MPVLVASHLAEDAVCVCLHVGEPSGKNSNRRTTVQRGWSMQAQRSWVRQVSRYLSIFLPLPLPLPRPPSPSLSHPLTHSFSLRGLTHSFSLRGRCTAQGSWVRQAPSSLYFSLPLPLPRPHVYLYHFLTLSLSMANAWRRNRGSAPPSFEKWASDPSRCHNSTFSSFYPPQAPSFTAPGASRT
jgi:hypothetical protein